MQRLSWSGREEWKKKEVRSNVSRIYSILVIYLNELCLCVGDVWECEKGRQTEPNYSQKNLGFGSWECSEWAHMLVGDSVQHEQWLKTKVPERPGAQQ